MRIGRLFAIPRSLYICIKLFGIRGGVKLPLLVANNVKMKGLRKGSVTIKNPRFLGMKIGFGGSPHITAGKTALMITGNGNITFHGNAFLSRGTAIITSGKLEFGKNYYNNKNCRINCNSNVVFGDDVLLGWDIEVMDSDGHTVLENGKGKPINKRIRIGNHVWISASVTILKGAEICANSIVSYGSIVISKFSEKNILIGGHPAKVIQQNIDWEK